MISALQVQYCPIVHSDGRLPLCDNIRRPPVQPVGLVFFGKGLARWYLNTIHDRWQEHATIDDTGIHSGPMTNCHPILEGGCMLNRAVTEPLPIWHLGWVTILGICRCKKQTHPRHVSKESDHCPIPNPIRCRPISCSPSAPQTRKA